MDDENDEEKNKPIDLNSEIQEDAKENFDNKQKSEEKPQEKSKEKIESQISTKNEKIPIQSKPNNFKKFGAIGVVIIIIIATFAGASILLKNDSKKKDEAIFDTDGDGIPDIEDTDDDNDGVLDENDAFPLDSKEWLDTDEDLVGNNADADDDNDGFPDSVEIQENTDPLDKNSKPSDKEKDTDSDGIPDSEDADDDNDGFNDTIDAFPFDKNEWLDTDEDGTGNNADTDDDNDGFTDSEEIEAGTDPLDKDSKPTEEKQDTDNDGIPDSEDEDDDDDGFNDNIDAFPLDKNEWLDTDEDGTGNNADMDDDNDGFNDIIDVFPINKNEWLDNDEDGTGDNADEDDDNDSYIDKIDAFPFDENEWLDTDSDEIGDNADTDDDNDSYSDIYEIEKGSDPKDANSIPDTDKDGLNDDEEKLLGTNPYYNDSDYDGLLDGEEILWNTDPLNPDTDGDNYTDGAEVHILGTPPYKFLSSELDLDNDGIPNKVEEIMGTNQSKNDTDGDGLEDFRELRWFCNPILTDSDTDGLPDGYEVNVLHTFPYGKIFLPSADSDKDELPDGVELLEIGSSPNKWSTDGDRYSDGEEWRGEIPGYVEGRGGEILYPAYPDIKVTPSNDFKIYIAQKIETEEGFIEADEYEVTTNNVDIITTSHSKTSDWEISGGVNLDLLTMYRTKGFAGLGVNVGGYKRESTLYSKSRTNLMSLTERNQITTIKQWKQAIETDLPESYIQTTLTIENIGNDVLQSGFDNIHLSLYVGNDSKPYKIKDNLKPNHNNIYPSQKIENIKVRFEGLDVSTLRRIDNGEPLRIEIEHCSFGEDQLYLLNAKGRLIRLDIDNGNSVMHDWYYSPDEIKLGDFLTEKADMIMEDNEILSIANLPIVLPTAWWDIILPNREEAEIPENIFDSPLNAGDHVVLLYQKDSDIDNLTDREEILMNLNISSPDTDDDYISDWTEIIKTKTDPHNNDTDGGGLIDGCEVNNGTDPKNGEDDPVEDTGMEWGENVRLTNYSGDSQQSDIAVDSKDNVHIVWYDNRDGNWEIYYKKLDSFRKVLVNDTRITNESHKSIYPSIAIDSNDNIHIVWYDERNGDKDIFYTKLDNNGKTLVDVSCKTFTATNHIKPEIVIDLNDKIHLIWQKEVSSKYRLYYKQLNNNGDTQINDKQLSSTSSSIKPSAIVDSSNDIHICWINPFGGHFYVKYKKIDDNGNEVVDQKSITSKDDSWYPSIINDTEGNIHIVWQYNNEIYYEKLDNDGNTIVDNKRITYAGGEYPDISIDKMNNISLVWQSQREGNEEIYYKKLNDTGESLSEDIRITNDKEVSQYPKVVVDSKNNVHIVWQDNRDGHFEIYYNSTVSKPTEPERFDIDYDFNMTCSENEKNINPGEEVTYLFEVNNFGNESKIRFYAVGLPNGWDAELSLNNVTLAKDETREIEFSVTTGEEVESGEYEIMVYGLMEIGDLVVWDIVKIITKVEE